MLNFAHFNPKNTHISTCKNVQIYTTALQMNSNHAYMHGYYSCANDFFILFFLSPLSNYFSSSTSTTTSSFPNVYNNLAQQNKKKEEKNNHQT